MEKQLIIIRRWLIFFMITLFLSGLTAIPVESGLSFLCRVFPLHTAIGDWLDKVYAGVHATNRQYPFLIYGYDWLAFAHFVLAILFVGPYQDPVRNKWVFEFGMIVCILIIPYAFIAGAARGIPFWWRLIDCSFGIGGLLPLGNCLIRIHRLEKLTEQTAAHEN